MLFILEPYTHPGDLQNTEEEKATRYSVYIYHYFFHFLSSTFISCF
ncbi:hypothetical protein HMPREF9554_00796 [Treponema phagedenis F0421]|nr:hypothetical protein HMPREF9554_00796 [Treponema phagedenis F0421]